MGLRIIPPDTNINFIGVRKYAYAFSIILILVGLISLVVKGGPRLGIDFAGGTIIQIEFDKGLDIDRVKSALNDVPLSGLTIQRFGQDDENTVLLRTSTEEANPEQIRAMVSEALASNMADTPFTVQRLEMVGPKVGADLRGKALEALFYAVLLIAIYISGRFEQRWMTSAIMAGGLAGTIYVLQLMSLPTTYLIVAAMLITLALCWYLKLNYALGAVVALTHDVIVTVGIFSLLNKEFDLTIIAALLTIVGYSLNDTIIVFDRIRENLRGKSGKSSLSRLVNKSINETLSRTILTSGTTLMVVFCLFLFGGGVIHDFAFALLVGIFVGTYSSIYVASPILLGFGPTLPDSEPEDRERAAV
ncbi:MAG: protein translocase subunit SecF [Deltaproteobacteria bacterium]|nr:protein translocase subunit SecF [Deltaproteobacteria bacterium]